MAEAKNLPSVVHIVPSLFRRDGGTIGGAERYALELARFMAKLTPTRLISFGQKEEKIQMGELSIEIIRPQFHVRHQASNPFSTHVFSLVRKADVIHCHQKNILMTSTVAAVARFLRKRVFVTDHGGGGWGISLYLSTDSWFSGEFYLSEYALSQKKTSDPKRDHVVFGGVDTDKFSPGPETSRRTEVLYVGRILPHKGVHHLIEAIEPKVRLRIVGPAPDENYLRELQKLGAGKDIVFDHSCDDAGIVQAYRQAAVIVLPSVYRDFYGRETKVPELLGQTLLEGMACCLPGIATRVASLPEVITEGKNGFLVEPNQAEPLREKIRWILSHPEEAARMGKEARRTVLEKFTWKRTVERCLEVYSQ